MAGPYSPDLQIIGVAKESTVGTAAVPTAYLKLEKFEPHIILGDAMDQSLRNDMADVHGTQQTTQYAEVSFSGKVAPDDLGWFLTNLYGSLATTGASAPYTHTISLLNSTDGQPPTHTFTHFNGVETRQYASARISDLTFKYILRDLVSIDGKFVAISYATGSKPSPAYTSIVPVAAWPTTFSIAGSTATQATDVELVIARTVTPVFTLNNTQVPYKIMAGGDFKSSGKATVVYETAAQFTAYLAGTTQAIVINTTTGAGAALIQAQHTSSVCYLNDAQIKAGSQYMELELNWTAQANATDAGVSGGSSPIKSVLQNATAASIYA